MSRNVCLVGNAFQRTDAGGHIWVCLNWALGLRSCGCDVVWIELLPRARPDRLLSSLRRLKAALEPYGLAGRVALCPLRGQLLPDLLASEGLPIHEVAAAADLLLDFRYLDRDDLLALFKRSALLDIDPGLTQIWIKNGQLSPAPHDCYFTIGETVGQPGARFSDCGLPWIYTPPCVALDHWPVSPAPPGAPYTTVSHWLMGEWVVDGAEWYGNDKRLGFLPYSFLPTYVDVPLELAIRLEGEPGERARLLECGWSVREASDVSATPWDYQGYIQRSRGEFSCVKPSCVRQQYAWISDRTLCYLASGKPAVVEHTGPSRFLPDAEGLLRFRTLKEAAARLGLLKTLRMASATAAASVNSTKPSPRRRPVTRSTGMKTSTILPTWEKRPSRSLSEVSYARLPMKILCAMGGSFLRYSPMG